jgi:hypothetical protein
MERRNRAYFKVRSRCFHGEKEESYEDSLSMKSTYRRQPIRGYNKDSKEGVQATTPTSSRENAVQLYSLGALIANSSLL